MDTTVSLACLQEEVLDTIKKDPRRGDFAPSIRIGMRTVVPLPLPPSRGASNGGNRPDERRGMDDKLRALRSYRRARGLCYTCGEKWSREHKCAATVQLHVVEELWDMLEESELNS